jgi:hypothetical protein
MQQKMHSPLAAVLGGLVLLDDTPDYLKQIEPWTLNLAAAFPMFPDVLPLRAEVLARLGRHDEARQLLSGLPSRALPWTRRGLRILSERLSFYEAAKSDVPNARALKYKNLLAMTHPACVFSTFELGKAPADQNYPLIGRVVKPDLFTAGVEPLEAASQGKSAQQLILQPPSPEVMIEQAEDAPIAAYDSGTVSTVELQQKLRQAWARVLANPEKRQETAGALGVDVAVLNKLSEPPVKIEAGRAFIDFGTAAVVVVTWFGSDILLGAFRDLAKDEVKKRIRQAWDVIEPELRSLFEDRNALGPLSRNDDDHHTM